MFAPIGSHANKNETEIVQKLKIENFEHRTKWPETCWIGSWIYAAVSEKSELTGDGHLRPTVALLKKSSRTKNKKPRGLALCLTRWKTMTT